MDEKHEGLLYQYTNIEALASILKNRTIRFNTLDKMDDLQEAMTRDLKNAARFVFISSWTKCQRELIPMWKLYTSLKRGVRIGLPWCPFEKHLPTKEEAQQVIHDGSIAGEDCFIPVSEMSEELFYTIGNTSKEIVCDVDYTDEKELLYPTLKDEENGTTKTFFNRLGKHKNTFWEFQEEVRYRFTAIPFKKMPITKKELNEIAEKIHNDEANPPFPSYDLKIDDDAFSKMTITLSPDIDPGIELAIRVLQKEYNPSACICESKLKGLIR